MLGERNAMKKSIRFMLVVGVCTSMLFGCQSAPVAQNENGVSFAKDSTQNSEVDEKTLGITQLDNVYHCKYTVKAKNREFNIDSDIQGYDKKSICVAEVESDVKNLSIDNINKAFMDGKGEVSISDNQSDLSVKDSFDNGCNPCSGISLCPVVQRPPFRTRKGHSRGRHQTG